MTHHLLHKDWASFGSSNRENKQQLPLPAGRNADGRPVCEPPIFDYSALIGEEYDKKRDAVLKYTAHDVVRTTKIIDAVTESDLLRKYWDWMEDMEISARDDKDAEQEAWFKRLGDELELDMHTLDEEVNENGVELWRNEEGKWEVDVISIASFHESDDSHITDDLEYVTADEDEDRDKANRDPHRILNEEDEDEELDWLSSFEPGGRRRAQGDKCEAEELGWMASFDPHDPHEDDVEARTDETREPKRRRLR